jgi:hypothetical protein
VSRDLPEEWPRKFDRTNFSRKSVISSGNLLGILQNSYS